jgi:hypothetical protein
MSINASVFKTIEELESKLQELRKIVGMAEIAAPVAPKKGRKSSKKAAKSVEEGAEGDAAPKEKKPLNPFMVFQGRLRELLKANGYSVAPKDGFPQFAGYLNDKTEKSEVAGEDGKSRKISNFDAWSDEAILAERSAWVKPAVSKQAEKGLNKSKSESSSTGSAESGEPEADAPAAAAAEKPKRVISEEQKAKMAAGRAAAKAKRDAEKVAEKPAASTAPVAAAAEAAAVIAEVDKVLAEPAAAPAPAKKPGKQLVKKVAKKVDLRFAEWEHEGTTYYKNERGDVLDQAFTWVGRYNEEDGEIDTDAEEAEFPEGVELIEA